MSLGHNDEPVTSRLWDAAGCIPSRPAASSSIQTTLTFLPRSRDLRPGNEAIGLDPNEAAVDDAASFPNPGTWSELNHGADGAARIASPIRRDEGGRVGRSQEEQQVQDALVLVRELAKGCRAFGVRPDGRNFFGAGVIRTNLRLDGATGGR